MEMKMSPQDEKLVEDLFNEVEPISNYLNDREPQVTADGYDYGILMSHFLEVVNNVAVEPQPGYFIAPGPSCTFSVH